jgi:hypothetical protein
MTFPGPFSFHSEFLLLPFPYLARNILVKMYGMIYKIPFCLFAIAGVKAQAPPLPPPPSSSTIAAAGGSIPTSQLATMVISPKALDELEVILYFENALAALLNLGANNISTWGIENYPNNTLEVITAAAAVWDVIHYPKDPKLIHFL